uniref:Protein kinase domain-containing protein n=1 Tax=Macrostomum lignano TaxID=282301 RepID=A0A1I8HZ45_9PLAT
MSLSIAIRRAEFTLILSLLCVLLTAVRPAWTQNRLSCRGPNNLPAPIPSCLRSRCQSDELRFALCSVSSAVNSSRAYLSVRILTDRQESNNSTAAPVVAVISFGSTSTQPIRYSYRTESLDNCSSCDLLIVTVESRIDSYSSLTVRVETETSVKVYGLYFIDWIATLGYVLRVSKTADGRVEPELVNSFYAMVSQPKRDSLYFKNSKIDIDLSNVSPDYELVRVARITGNLQEWMPNTRRGAAGVHLADQGVDCDKAAAGEGGEIQRDSSTALLLLALLLPVGVAIVAVGCLIYVLYTNLQQKRYTNRRILLIVVVSPRCLKQLRKLRSQQGNYWPLPTRKRQAGWDRLRCQAASLGYQLAVLDCSAPTSAGTAQRFESTVASASKVLILDDGLTETMSDSEENGVNQQVRLLQRLVMLEKHRCTLLQPSSQSELNEQVGGILRDESETSGGRKLLLPSDRLGVSPSRRWRRRSTSEVSWPRASRSCRSVDRISSFLRAASSRRLAKRSSNTNRRCLNQASNCLADSAAWPHMLSAVFRHSGSSAPCSINDSTLVNSSNRRLTECSNSARGRSSAAAAAAVSAATAAAVAAASAAAT